MTNFIFKSGSDLQKISQQLLTVLNNQRHLRNDLAKMSLILDKLLLDKNLQSQVDDFYDGSAVDPQDTPDDSSVC